MTRYFKSPSGAVQSTCHIVDESISDFLGHVWEHTHVGPFPDRGEAPFLNYFPGRRLEHDDWRVLIFPGGALRDAFPEAVVQIVRHLETLRNFLPDVHGLKVFVHEERRVTVPASGNSNVSLRDHLFEVFYARRV